MRLDVWKYKSNTDGIRKICEMNNGMELGRLCSTIAVATHIPLLAVYYIVEDILGSSEELEGMKARIKEFYKYKEVILENPDADSSTEISL